jgi:hypothetical protein
MIFVEVTIGLVDITIFDVDSFMVVVEVTITLVDALVVGFLFDFP